MTFYFRSRFKIGESNSLFIAQLFGLIAGTTFFPKATIAATLKPVSTIELDDWNVEISPQTLSFTALLNGGTRFNLSDETPRPFKSELLSTSEKQIRWYVPEQQTTISAEAKGNRLHILFNSRKERQLRWPILKENAQVTAFIVPDGEGLYLPVGDPFWVKKFSTKSCQTFHGGVSMPFFGVASAAANFAFIVPSDLHSDLCLENVGDKIGASATHDFKARNGLEEFEVIIVPTANSPISAAIEYRKWLKETKHFVSLEEKISRNPEVKKLVGASHAYLWGDGRTKDLVTEFHGSGVDHMWLGYDQDPRSEKYLVDESVISTARELGYLIGPYDTFDNIQPTKSSDAISSIFDDELFRDGCVIKKDGKKMTGFAGRGCQLSSEALRRYRRPFLKERIETFKTSGANAYFLDCDAFGEFLDDYDKQHPMDQAKDRKNRAERMDFISDESKLVLGSEGGTAWATKYVAFLHGANDTFNTAFWPLLNDKKRFGTWWPPEEMGVFFKKVKVDDDFMTAKYSPSYRVPLFQAVFHDSVVSTERWELSLSKIPAAAKVRALFWQLYSAAPIWNINRKEWRRYKEYIVEHHAFFSEIHRDTAFLAITRFDWLDTEKRVQRVTFGDSITVTANFSGQAFESLKPLCIESVWKETRRKRSYCPQTLPE